MIFLKEATLYNGIHKLDSDSFKKISKPLSSLEIGKVKVFMEKYRFNGKKLDYLAMDNKIDKLVFVIGDNMINYNRSHFNRLDYKGQEEYMSKLQKKSLQCQMYIEKDTTYYEIPINTAKWLMENYPNIETYTKL
jgi:hypothetical protein